MAQSTARSDMHRSGSALKDAAVLVALLLAGMAVASLGIPAVLAAPAPARLLGVGQELILGISSRSQKVETPVEVSLPGEGGVVGVTPGKDHMFAATGDGTVWAWGEGASRRLCVGDTTTDERVPVVVSGVYVDESQLGERSLDDGRRRLMARAGQTMTALWGTEAGTGLATVLTCGTEGISGALGHDGVSPIFTPTAVAGLPAGKIEQVDAIDEAVVVVVDGAVWAWGHNNAQGRIGLGDTIDRQNTPVQVPGLESGVTAIKLGLDFMLVVRNGALLTSGRIDGDSQFTVVAHPTLTSGISDVAACANTMFAVLDGEVVWWGAVAGIFAVGTGASYPGYSTIPGLGGIVQIEALTQVSSNAYMAARTADGSVYALGTLPWLGSKELDWVQLTDMSNALTIATAHKGLFALQDTAAPTLSIVEEPPPVVLSGMSQLVVSCTDLSTECNVVFSHSNCSSCSLSTVSDAEVPTAEISLSLSEESDVSLVAIATDAFNQSSQVEVDFVFDGRPPRVSVVEAPSGRVSGTTHTFRLSCDDFSLPCVTRVDFDGFEGTGSGAVSSVEADGGVWVLEVPADVSEDVEVSFVVEDAAGNAAEPVTVSFYADTRMPVATFDETPPEFSNSDVAYFGFGCTESGCVFDYKSDDDSSWVRVGDDGGGGATGVAPQTVLSGGPSSLVVSSTVAEFELSATGAPLDLFQVRLDGAGWQPRAVDGGGVAVVSLDSLSDGPHSIQARAVGGDAGGVQDDTPVGFNWVVDTESPNAFIRQGPPASGDDGTTAAFSLECTEGYCLFDFVLQNSSAFAGGQFAVLPQSDDGTFSWTPVNDSEVGFGAAQLAVAGLNRGETYRVVVRARDVAGNGNGKLATYEWHVEDLAITIVQSPLSGTPHETLVFVFQRSQSVQRIEYRVVQNSSGTVVRPWSSTAQLVVRISDLPPTLELTLEARGVDEAGEVGPLLRHDFHRGVPPLEVEINADVPSAVDEAVSRTVANFQFVMSAELGELPSPALSSWQDAVAEAAAVEYSVDNAEWVRTWRELAIGPISSGVHTLRVRAEDINGIEGPISEFSWEVTAQGTSTLELFSVSDGPHALQVRAIDLAGNVQVEPSDFEWVVDATPPSTEARLVTETLTNSPSSTVVANATEEVSSFRMQVVVDQVARPWQDIPGHLISADLLSCTFVIDNLGSGDHVVRVRAVDRALNQDSSFARVAYVVDFDAPDTTAVVEAAMFGLSTQSSVDVGFTEPGCVVYARVNAGPWIELTGSVAGLSLSASLAMTMFPNVDDIGETATLEFRSVDPAGNVDASPAAVVVSVDVKPPTVSVSVVGGLDIEGGVVALSEASAWLSLVLSEPSTVRAEWAPLSALEAVEECEVHLPDQELRGNVTCDLAGDGAYAVSVSAIDAVGNERIMDSVAVVLIDTTPPDIISAPSSASFLNSSAMDVAVETNEINCTLLLTVSGPNDFTYDAITFPRSPTDTISTVRIVSSSDDGPHLAEIHAVDRAGNVDMAPWTHEFVVDRVAPTITVAAATTGLLTTGFVNTTDVFLALQGIDATAVRVWVVLDGMPAESAEFAGPGGSALLLDATEAVEQQFYFSASGLSPGLHEISALAFDDADNGVESDVVQWTVDTEAPAISLRSSVGELTRFSEATFEVECTDALSPRCSFEILLELVKVDACGNRIEGEADVTNWVDVESVSFTELATTSTRRLSPTSLSTTLRQLGHGGNAVRLRSIDMARNVGDEMRHVWEVDSEPPSPPTFRMQPGPVISDVFPAFSVVMEDEPDAEQLPYQWRLGRNSPWQNVTEDPFRPDAPLAEGDHVVQVRGFDVAGNPSDVSEAIFKVVTTPPETELASAPPLKSGWADAEFHLVATQGGIPCEDCTFEVRIDGGEWAEATDCGDGDAGVCVYRTRPFAFGAHTFEAQARNSAGIEDPSSAAHQWSIQACSDDEYARLADDGAVTCVGCPTGAVCSGNEGNVTYSLMGALEGWFTSGSSEDNYYRCPLPGACLGGGYVDDQTGLPVTEGEAARLGLALGGNASTPDALTASFHKSRCSVATTGILCSLCAPGYFMNWGNCQPCPEQSETAYGYLAAVFVGALALAAIAARLRDHLPVTLIKCLFGFAQIVASANSSYAIPWPVPVQAALNSMKVMLFEIFKVTKVSCANESFGFYATLVTTLAGFKVVLFFLCVGFYCYLRRRVRMDLKPEDREQRTMRYRMLRRRILRKWISVTTLFASIAYPPLSMNVLKTFSCVTVDGDAWLEAEMRSQCFTDEWFAFAIYAGVMGVLVTIGYPLCLFIALFRKRHHLHEPKVIELYGGLYQDYTMGRQSPAAFWWESEELVRRLCLASLVVLFDKQSPVQVAFACMVSVAALTLHALYRPMERVAYLFQLACLQATFVTFLVGMLWKLEGIETGGTSNELLTWLVVILDVGVLGAGAVAVLAIASSRMSTTARKALRDRAEQTILQREGRRRRASLLELSRTAVSTRVFSRPSGGGWGAVVGAATRRGAGGLTEGEIRQSIDVIARSGRDGRATTAGIGDLGWRENPMSERVLTHGVPRSVWLSMNAEEKEAAIRKERDAKPRESKELAGDAPAVG